MKAGVLSPTSTCHTFDASADGYGRGDGIGALYVKRLSDAIRDGDPIRSVVRASAINANGKTAGISLPSADGQEAVIRKAMAKGGISPSDITYIECHGTGTKVGDAIEVDALSRVFQRTPQQPLLIGSVKSNVGHSEAASGIAGVLKATLALEHGQIPPTYGLKVVNPKLKIEERNFGIPTEVTKWPANSPPVRRIGINSFGYGGANAHVILEEAPLSKIPQGESRDIVVSQSAVVLPLSATTPESLDARLADLADFDFTNVDILDLSYTLGSRRTHFPVRGFLVASRAEPIASSLKTRTLITSASPSKSTSSPFAFVFTGQGSQWPGMCRELFTEFPVFRHAIAEMDSVLQSLPHKPDWSLQEAALDTQNVDLIHLPQRSQTCCTAIQVALLQLLATWGIFPSMTVGHSSGEIAAAFAAGHISAAEAIVIAYYRGYCVSKSTTNGSMMAAGLSQAAATEEIHNQGLDGQIRVACVNSPEGVTISGNNDAIDKLLGLLQEKKTFARKLKTGGQAYHSHHMLAIGEEYESNLAQVLPTLGDSIRMPKGATVMSSVVVGPKSSGFTPSYWRSNLESPVLFTQAIDQINKIGEHCYIELGPHSSLELPIKQTLAVAGISGSQVKYAAPVKRNSNALESALSFAGSLWLQGFNIDWSKVNGLNTSLKSSTPLCRVVTDLPPYKFSYENTLWTECRASLEYRQRKYPRHELLGTLTPGGNGEEFIFRNILKVDDVSWLKDHKLEETVVFPGAGYLCMAMEAVTQVTNTDISKDPSFELSNVNIINALALSEDAVSQKEIFTMLRKTAITNTTSSSTWWDFSISTYQEGTSVQHATGSIAINAGSVALKPKYQAPEGLLESTAKRIWYEKFIKYGLNYGPSFQAISEVLAPRMKSASFCGATTPLLTACGDPLTKYPIHPITLDAMIQLAIIASTNGVPKALRAQVPTRLASITLNTAARYSDEQAVMNTLVQRTGPGSSEGGVEILSSSGEVLAQFDKLRLAPYQAAGQAEDEDKRHPVLRVLWKPDVYGLGFMSSDDAAAHAQKFADEADSPVSDDGLLKLGAILDLLVHKNPRLRVLELGNSSHDLTLAVLELLAYHTDFKRMSTYSTASIAEDGSFSGGVVDLETGERNEKPTTLEDGVFDLVIIPGAGSWLSDSVSKVKALLADDATILALCPGATGDYLTSSDLSCLSFPISQEQANLVVARQAIEPNKEKLTSHKFLIVEREQSRLGSALADALSAIQGHWTTRVLLHELTAEHVAAESTVFNLCEVNAPLLSVTSEEDMKRIKIITDGASSLVWVTNGNMLEGDKPDYALASGLARTLSLEQPSLKFYNFDVDEPDVNAHITSQRLISVLNQPGAKEDLEFVQRKGVVHISRFTPDEEINKEFRVKQGLETSDSSLGDVGDVRLDIKHPGQFDTVYFKQLEPPQSIGETEVRVKVASVGMNAKDYYVLAGRVDTPNATCQLECAGTVVQVGSAVTDLTAGDRVVAMAPTHFQSYQTLPRWACHKLLSTESFDVCATLPLVYSTAIYALHYRANLQSGEKILIHSGAGGVGMAAIQLALNAGAEVRRSIVSS